MELREKTFENLPLYFVLPLPPTKVKDKKNTPVRTCGTNHLWDQTGHRNYCLRFPSHVTPALSPSPNFPFLGHPWGQNAPYLNFFRSY